MKDFTKRDWILLSISAGIALSGVLYNQHLQAQESLEEQQPLPTIKPTETYYDFSELNKCEFYNNCTTTKNP